MANNPEIWRLSVILTGGSKLEVCGSEDVLGIFVKEYKDALDNPIGTENCNLSVAGYCDTADRAPTTLIVVLGHVAAVFLTKLTY